MARKRQRRFSAVTTVKEMARERIGSPRPSRLVPDGRRKKLAKLVEREMKGELR